MERSIENYIKAQRVFNSQSYMERRLSLHRGMDHKYPRFLYKYRAVNPDNEESIDRIRDILVRSGLWLSSPTKFNDPFDMAAYIYVDGSGLEKRKKAKKLAKSKGLKRKERNQLINKIARSSNKDIRKFTTKSYKKQLKSMGVCSFAGDPRSILMWSHYAADHTGICIQFEIAHEFTMVGSTLEVKYLPEYPKLNWLTAEPEEMQDILLRKFEGWTYENEHRMILLGKANHKLRYNSNALTGIILGCRTPDNTIERIRELLNERKESGKPDVKLYRAVQHKSNFALSIFKL